MKEAFDLMKEKIMHDRRIGRSSLEAFLEILREVEAEFGKDINVLGNGWIPCDRGNMPEDDRDVLVQYDTGRVGIAWYYKSFGWDSEDIQNSVERLCVIAWMPLPEPYKPTTD